MSEEILKALMQLFGIIAKQDDGVNQAKRKYVDTFLRQQIGDDQVEEYFALFEKNAIEKKKRRKEKEVLEGEVKDEPNKEIKKEESLTSMTDSVRTLGICKKINKTLTQKQKVVVIVRLLELVNSDGNFSVQRIAIIDTASQVFKIDKNEYKSIEAFVKGNSKSEINDENVLVLADNAEELGANTKFLKSDNLDRLLIILLVPSANLYFIRYNGKNDIVLNGLGLNNRRIYLFASGSTIKPPFGKTVYYSDVSSIFLSAQSDERLSFNANNIVYKFPNGNIGLRGVSVSEGAGKLIGIMGASGAGKTTLLNVLAGLETPTEGEVLINGIDLHKESEKLEGVIGYVPQDDLLIEELTVFQNLFYNAKLCFNDLSDEEITVLVLETLENLALTKTNNLKVGSPLEKTISGGQRKRLNIALELIREPSVLFLDEPTSGLSSKDSENILDLLRQMALKGKLIFVVIHQPSSEIYKSFDKIFFLDTGGYLIYNGNPVEAVIYFKSLDRQINSEQGECITCGNVNPELIFNIVEAKIVDEYGNLTPKRKVLPEKWSGYYKDNIDEQKIPDELDSVPPTLQIPSKLKQYLVFLTRDFKAKISNSQYILINLLETPVLAMFLAFIIRYIADPESDVYIYRENENVPAYILMCIVVALFVGLTVSAEEIFKDRKILKRESFLNLSKASYLFSKISILFTLSAVQSILLVVIGNTILGIKGMYFEYWMMLFAISCFANVLGLNISNSFNSAVTIYIIIPLLIIPQMVLAGAMFSFDKLNRAVGGGYEVPIIAQIMPSRWAYEGLVVNQFVNNEFQKQWYNYERRESAFDYKMAYYIPELEKTLEESVVLFYSKKTSEKEVLSENLELLRNEISKELKINKGLKFSNLDLLTKENFKAAVIDSALVFFNNVNDLYSKKYNAIVAQKELKLEQMFQADPIEFTQVKSNYENEYLTEIVKNTLAKKKIIKQGNKLIQIMDPVYQEPKEATLLKFNYPFYSPYKYLFNIKLSTFAFNTIVIWMLTLLLFIALYFNWMPKMLNIADLLPVKKNIIDE